MKKWNRLYDVMRSPIKLLVVAFMMVGLGSFVQNPNLNVFYTFRNSYVIIISEAIRQLGEVIILNFPLIVLIRLVSRRLKSGAPITLGLVGYFSFLVSTMIFQNPSMISEAYGSLFKISYDATGLPTVANGMHYPIETGLIGVFIVALITRWAYIRSRRPSGYSIMSIFNKDSAAYIYVIPVSALAGILVSLVWPYVSIGITYLINYIGDNTSDPIRMGVYGASDRFLSALGLNNYIRNAFYYTAKGGTYTVPITGQTIVGDLNIYSKIIDLKGDGTMYGKFTSAYYVINIFMIPALIFGLHSSISDSRTRLKSIFVVIVAVLASVIYGNPLPYEMMIFLAAPLLYIIYLAVIFGVFAATAYYKAYVGYAYTGATVTAMPGNLPDFLIKLRDVNYHNAIVILFLAGLAAAAIIFIATRIYTSFLAYTNSSQMKNFAKALLESVGGKENIAKMVSTPFSLSLQLNNQELIDYEKINGLDVYKISETSNGVILYAGMSSNILRKTIINLND